MLMGKQESSRINLFRANIINQVDNTIAVSKFIIIPSNQFDKVWCQLNSGFSIKYAAIGIADKIGRDSLKKQRKKCFC